VPYRGRHEENLDQRAVQPTRFLSSQLFSLHDSEGNNLLMDLARTMKDDALRELLTNASTSNFVTHTVLRRKNDLGQTLLALIEVNREALSESLPLVLKKEYGCHRRDMMR